MLTNNIESTKKWIKLRIKKKIEIVLDQWIQVIPKEDLH